MIDEVSAWFVTAAYPLRGDGSDTNHDMLTFFKRFGFECENTLKDGHFRMLLKEQRLIHTIPAGTTLLTTWPGMPRQMLVTPGWFNGVRFSQFIRAKRRNGWRLAIMPIDLPLEQFRQRLQANRVASEAQREKKLFEEVDVFLCCGKVMAEYFGNEYPNTKIARFDLYDQILRDSGDPALVPNDGRIKIAISGNLTRMRDCISLLPRSKDIMFCFTGPGGDWIVPSGRSDCFYLGNLPAESLIPTLRQCHYGLVVYSEGVADYFARVIAGKVTSYLLAGLPVICPDRYTAMAEFVNRSNTGIAIQDIDQLINLRDFPEKEYRVLSTNSCAQAKEIQHGCHYRTAAHEAGLLQE